MKKTALILLMLLVALIPSCKQYVPVIIPDPNGGGKR